MSFFSYSPEKNLQLIDKPNISFEEIIAAIEDDQLLDVLEHPNQKKYGNQKIYVVCAKEYVYLVPFVIDTEGNVFLKTIIPSKKEKKIYSKRGQDEKKE